MENEVMNAAVETAEMIEEVIPKTSNKVVLATVGSVVGAAGLYFVGKKVYRVIKNRKDGKKVELEEMDPDELYVEEEDAEKIKEYVKSNQED